MLISLDDSIMTQSVQQIVVFQLTYCFPIALAKIITYMNFLSLYNTSKTYVGKSCYEINKDKSVR